MSKSGSIPFEDLSSLIEKLEAGKPITSLKDFAQRLKAAKEPKLAAAVAKISTPSDLGFRLLGVYARLRYGKEMEKILAELVSVKTDRLDNVEPSESPQMVEFGEIIADIAEEFGLEFENIGPNQVFRVWVEGSSGMKDVASAYASADVASVMSPQWTITKPRKKVVDAFDMTPVGNRLYGRGTQNCKGGLTVALFALRVLKEAEVNLRRTVMLTIGTSEESGGESLQFLQEELVNRGEKPPTYNVVLDGKYPVQVAEMGYGVMSVSFAESTMVDTGGEIEILAVTGSAAVNQISARSVVALKCSVAKLEKVRKKLEDVAASYAESCLEHGEFSIKVTDGLAEPGALSVKVEGTAGHSSDHDAAVNTVSRAFGFLAEAAEVLRFRPNRWLAAARYANDLFGIGYTGEQWGIAAKDKPPKKSAVDLGPLIIGLTQIRGSSLAGGGADDKSVLIDADLRLPRGSDYKKVQDALLKKLQAWKRKTGLQCEVEFPEDKWWNATATNESQAWIKDLCDLFTEVSGVEAPLAAGSMSSSARFFANSINFGPLMPDAESPEQPDHEFKLRSQLLLDAQLITEMYLQIGTRAKR